MEQGTVFAGRFQIESIAGHGGVGTIYKALDLRSRSHVALKMLRGGAAVDQARFSREARALSQIDHPGLVRYLEHGVLDDHTPYLVMEWLEGEDLKSLLNRQGITIGQALSLGRRVADVLSVLHDNGIVHRDIKPANLFLPGGAPAEVKVLDLGLVRTADDALSLTHTGLTVGTPGYMSPEQARGEKGVDARTDVFSLGCVLYRCLTGRPPFEGAHMVEVMTKLILEEPPDVAELCPAAPPELTALIRRMMAKDPSKRPGSAAEVAASLRAIELPAGVSDALVPSPGAPPLSLTAEERWLAGVILVGPPVGASGPGSGPAPGAGSPGAVVTVAATFHAAVEHLAGDVKVVHFTGAGSQPGDASRAAHCALAIRAALPGSPIALTTGRSELTGRAPVGDAIERATASLVAENADFIRAMERGKPLPAWIGVDAVTASLLGASFDVREVKGSLRLYGLAETSGNVRTVLGKEIPLLGRDWEMSALLGICRACAEEGSARAALVLGAAGAGKSRLARELRAALSRELPDVQIWHARADASAEGSPLALLLGAIRDGLGLGAGAPAAEQQRLVLDAMRERFPAERAGPASELLLEMLDLPLPGPASAALRAARSDARIHAQRARELFEQLITSACAAAPLVLLLEDLQWGDGPTTRFVGHALRSLAGLPWAVIAFGRPDVTATFPGLWQDCDCQTIRVRPLSRKAAEQMIHHVLGDTVPAATLQRIVAQADGNAFYIEEMIRAFAASGAAGESGVFPETILAMVQARLSHLDAETRRALRAASIFGEVVWPAAVDLLLGRRGSWSASTWADALVMQEILVRRPYSRFEGEPEVAFRHALLREGAYVTLTAEDRALGHRLAGEWLEQKGEPDPLVLAKHFDEGGERAKAVRYYVDAAQRAMLSMDLTAAIERAERARSLDASGADHGRIHAVLAEAYLWRSSWGKVAEHAREVLKTAPPGSELWMRGLNMQQSAASSLGEVGLMIATIGALTSVEPSPEARAAAIQAHGVAAFVLAMGRQFDAARGMLHRLDGLAAAATERHLVPLGWAHFGRGVVEGWGAGDAGAAVRCFVAACALFDEAGDRQNGGFARCLLAMFYQALGAHGAADRELSRIGPEAEPGSLVAVTRDDQRMLLRLATGAFDDARAAAAARVAAAPDDRMGKGLSSYCLGAIALAEGHLDEAERALSTANDLLRGTHTAWSQATLALGRAHLLGGRRKEALACAEEVLGMVEAHHAEGLGGLAARLFKAEVLLASGEPGAAAELLAECRRRLLDAAERIEDAEARAGYLRDVPEHRRILERTGGEPAR